MFICLGVFKNMFVFIFLDTISYHFIIHKEEYHKVYQNMYVVIYHIDQTNFKVKTLKR